jgi:hypothetical protein
MMADGRDVLQHNAHPNFQEWTNFVDRMDLDFTEAAQPKQMPHFNSGHP